MDYKVGCKNDIRFCSAQTGKQAARAPVKRPFLLVLNVLPASTDLEHKNTKSYQTKIADSQSQIQNHQSKIEMAETTGFEPVEVF